VYQRARALALSANSILQNALARAPPAGRANRTIQRGVQRKQAPPAAGASPRPSSFSRHANTQLGLPAAFPRSSGAGAAGGASDLCAARFREAQPALVALAGSKAGRRLLARAFRTCEPLASKRAAEGLLDWVCLPLRARAARAGAPPLMRCATDARAGGGAGGGPRGPERGEGNGVERLYACLLR
jgi:hypothetical protein